MDALETLKTRRCVRKFKPEPVADPILADIVDCARLAPTAINIQPWEFVVVKNEARRQQIAESTDNGRFIAEAPACIVVLCKDTKYYLEDGCAATENILLAAAAYGLGACWVAGDKKPYAKRICELVHASPEHRLISLIPLGYPAEEPAKEKRPLQQVLHWETF